jgi:hypothetical protein
MSSGIQRIMLSQLIISICFASTLFQQNVGADIALGSGWRRVATDDKEFAVVMPVTPPAHESTNYYLHPDGARIKWARAVTGYSGRAAFVVHIYDTSDPKKLLKDLLGLETSPDSSISDFSLGGYVGKRVVTSEKDFHIDARYLATRRRVYVVSAAARDKDDPDVNRFMSSLRLGSDGVTDAQGVSQSGVGVTGDSPGASAGGGVDKTVYQPSEVSRKALIVFKPNPRSATEPGVVKLRMILSSTGEVSNIEVLKGLDKETTKKAVEEASYIRFLPAERDGHLVSQWVNIEYSFK